MPGKKVNWEKFREGIGKAISTLGSENLKVIVTESSTRSATGKKVVSKVFEYKGKGVRGIYDSRFDSPNSSMVKAGDLKFTVQFDDITFEPTEKKDEKIVFEDVTYTVIYVESVQPAETNIIWSIYARRIN